jgi:hypothetical protein
MARDTSAALAEFPLSTLPRVELKVLPRRDYSLLGRYLPRAYSPSTDERQVLNAAQPLLRGALDYLTALYSQELPENDPWHKINHGKLSRLPQLEALLTPKGYHDFWRINPDISTRHRIFIAVMQTGLIHLRSFGPPRAAPLKHRKTPHKLDAA